MSKRILLTTFLAVASIGVGGVAIAAPQTATHGAPVHRSAPTSPPSTRQTKDGCQVRSAGGDQTDSSKGLVWVRPNPTLVTAEWVPGSNDKACESELTVSEQAVARRLAKEVETSKQAPSGVFCPLDDGTAVNLFFDYANGKQEYVSVALSGCSWMSAPSRTARERSAAFDKTMKQIAPSDWRKDFS